MNKTLALSLAVLAASGALATACGQNDQDAVIGLTQQAAKGVEHVDDAQISQVAIVDGYALTTWSGSNGSGQAVLHKGQFTWAVLAINNNKIDAGGMGGLGVPSETAYKLESSLQPVSAQ